MYKVGFSSYNVMGKANYSVFLSTLLGMIRSFNLLDAFGRTIVRSDVSFWTSCRPFKE